MSICALALLVNSLFLLTNGTLRRGCFTFGNKFVCFVVWQRNTFDFYFIFVEGIAFLAIIYGLPKLFLTLSLYRNNFK